MRKGSARTLAALHGELIDHSAFRGLAQEARATGQHDAGPVARPGQPAARVSRDGVPDWKGIAGRLRNGSIRAPCARFSPAISPRFADAGGSARLAHRTE
ncbi:hypothetical protein CUJ89_04195 [Burkholderia pyrrocinia]|uniref:Uncharacterized protein n=1 Tax=Burkholderia pyrrocinia TaxID=60550 RepID=A0A2Z5MR89_BURPY|nr:hypothetical protein CUJ89_04195 [Burkholderia pyrrocinia]